jgi:hypothetical protein
MGEQPIIRLGAVQEDPEKPTFWELPGRPVGVTTGLTSGWEGFSCKAS